MHDPFVGGLDYGFEPAPPIFSSRRPPWFALALNLLIILLAQFGAMGPALGHASAGVWQGSDFMVPDFGYNKSQL